jgi:hypothetical protein
LPFLPLFVVVILFSSLGIQIWSQNGFVSDGLLGSEIYEDGLVNFGSFSMLFLCRVADKLRKMYTWVKKNGYS